MRRVPLLTFFLALASTCLAFDPARMREDTSLALVRTDFGNVGLAKTDLDGDGQPELVLGSSSSSSSYWTILGRGTPGTLDRVLVERSFGRDRCRLFRVADVDADGVDELVAIVSPANDTRRFDVLVLDLRSGATKGRFNLYSTANYYSPTPTDLLVADVEGGPGPEIFVINSQDLWMARLGEGVVWTFGGAGGTSMGLGNIDSDPEKELVIATGSGVTGMVLEPARRRMEWVYTPGFGASVAVVDVDADGRAEIFFSSQRTVSRIDGSSRTPTWTTVLSDFYSGDASSLVVETLPGEGRPTVVVRIVNNWLALDSATGARGGRTYACCNGARPFVLFDLGDCVPGFVVPYGGSVFWSAFGATQAVAVGPQAADVSQPAWLAVGPVLGDGRSKLLSSWSSSSYNGALVRRDLHHDVEEARTAATNGGAYFGPLSLAQVDADPALELAVPEHSVSGRVSVLDGLTGAVEWSTSLLYGEVTALVFGELPGASPVLAVATRGDYYSGYGYGYFVRLYAASSGVLLWKSPDLSGTLNDMAIADVDGTGHPEVLVAVSGKGLVSLDVDSGQEMWTLPPPEASAVAVGDVNGDGRPDIVVGRGATAYVAYDGPSRALLFEATLGVGGSSVKAIRVADLDGDGTPELVMTYGEPSGWVGGVAVVRPADQAVLWQRSEPPGGSGGALFAGDVDDDGKTEVLTGTWLGVTAYEYDSGVPDLEAPVWNGSAGVRTALAKSDACCPAVELTWGIALDASSPPVRYRVYRGPVGFVPSPTSRVAEVSGSRHVDRGLSPNAVYEYVVRAVDRLGNEDENDLHLDVETNSDVTIRIEPGDQTTCPADAVTFRATVSGGSVSQYTWYRDGIVAAGSYGPTYDASIAGSYRCGVSLGSCPQRLSSPSVLSITRVPGDASGDCVFGLGDLFSLARWFTYSYDRPTPPDVNGDGALDIKDLDYLADFFLAGGPAPVH